MSKRILALDLGTHCGYAMTATNCVEVGQAGTFQLRPEKHEGPGYRLIRFERYLNEMLPDMIFYEAVRRHLGVDAAHIYGALLGKVQEYCERKAIPYKGFEVAEIKKRATGKGNANKEAMIGAAKRQFGYQGDDDNTADALWILQLGLESIAGKEPF